MVERGGSIVEKIIAWVTGLAAFVVLFDAAWITYGVFARYVLRSPDRFVIEATSLLLIPLIFAGVPYALKTEGFPRVTVLLDRISGRPRALVDRLNLALMVFVGGFYLMAAVAAVASAHAMGSTSDILLWPEFIFWIPMAVSLSLFVVYGLYLLWTSMHLTPRHPDPAG